MSSTTCTTAATPFGEALIAAAAARPGSGSRCSTRATSRAGSASRSSGAQRRFTDGDAARWAERVAGAARGAARTVGAAIHSVRAVPADQLATVVEWARGKPLHFHVSEQRAENEACLAAHGCTPAQLLAEHGALGPDSTAVHATHLTAATTRALRRDHDLHVPDDRARPRRRHRPGRPATLRARQRQPRGHRPLRGGARGRAQPAPEDRAPRPLHGAPRCSRRDQPRLPRLGRRRPDRARRPRGPRHGRPRTRVRLAGAAPEHDARVDRLRRHRRRRHRRDRRRPPHRRDGRHTRSRPNEQRPGGCAAC